ncbi:hypothetical protein [Absidia glauca]|uniref:Uncharacterized protein n=1 Tax=Absidia glauca TaxID=4829 RepID=A0A163JY99_ABSGL|nr:hypothetical protein [Absidia glauca]
MYMSLDLLQLFGLYNVESSLAKLRIPTPLCAFMHQLDSPYLEDEDSFSPSNKQHFEDSPFHHYRLSPTDLPSGSQGIYLHRVENSYQKDGCGGSKSWSRHPLSTVGPQQDERIQAQNTQPADHPTPIFDSWPRSTPHAENWPQHWSGWKWLHKGLNPLTEQVGHAEVKMSVDIVPPPRGDVWLTPRELLAIALHWILYSYQ